MIIARQFPAWWCNPWAICWKWLFPTKYQLNKKIIYHTIFSVYWWFIDNSDNFSPQTTICHAKNSVCLRFYLQSSYVWMVRARYHFPDPDSGSSCLSTWSLSTPSQYVLQLQTDDVVDDVAQAVKLGFFIQTFAYVDASINCRHGQIFWS